MENRNVDIIIPIYNAYEDLQKCIASIQKWTDMQTCRMILINDCSTDERMYPYLEQLKNEQCIVIHNDKNQGFSANINIGIAQSNDRDVILLNSDTVVTKNWVEKLKSCACLDPWTATVTPLSNNATLCSVPYFGKENKLPDGYTLDEYAELIERISLKRYPQIPVANGFCMYVKREIISLIGVFDAQTFEKGYGEENDFCYRAIEAGYHHVMCDDTFILHTGTSSFADGQKRKYMLEHEKILDRRYPYLMQDVRVHCRDIPTAIISQNVRLRTRLDRYKKRKTILYLLQSDFREDAPDHIGGIQMHVKDLTHELRKDYNVVVLARNRKNLNVTFYAEKKELYFRFYIGDRPRYEIFRSVAFAQLYGRILDVFTPDLVHIHHVMGLTLELYYEADKRKIPVYTTLHDYYFVCPNITLLNEKDQLCTGKPCAHCTKCLRKQKEIDESLDYRNIWLKQHEQVLLMTKTIFVPSQSTKQIVLKVYPDLRDKIVIQEHGTEQGKRKKKSSKISEKASSRKFHVAFLGAINAAKGFQLVTDLIRKKDKNIEWYLFGYFEKEMPDLEKKQNFHNMGPYQREDLPEFMQKYSIDLICILPKCPETFCYTLSEAIASRVPVLVTDVGALGERCRQMNCGWIVPDSADKEEVYKQIVALKEHREIYRQKLQQVKQIPIKTRYEMCQDYLKSYQIGKIEGKKFYGRQTQTENEWLMEGYFLQSEDQKDDLNMQNRLASAEQQLYEITHSFSYRAILKLAVIPVPVRQRIKALLLRVYRIFENQERKIRR